MGLVIKIAGEESGGIAPDMAGLAAGTGVCDERLEVERAALWAGGEEVRLQAVTQAINNNTKETAKTSLKRHIVIER